ncbi:MAG: hypothetical protein K2L68_01965, partial [Muribaculaceae bacterium]|nr:hypothetical protein [Muribaculaceae bacterium]
MTPTSLFLALFSTVASSGLYPDAGKASMDTIVCHADSIPVRMMSGSASDNTFSPLLTLDEVTALPSPDVAAMTRHIDEGIDYSTGTGGLSIPLYSWSSGDLQLSIGLQYRLGAYKVKERAGWVGLGWNLTGAGCVTRDIVGLPDEKNDTPIRTDAQIRAGGNGHLYLQEIEEFRADSDLDRYRYSCPGAEGSFVIKSGKIVQTPETDNIIEFHGTERDGVKDFVVTTPDGTRYYFTEREKLAFRIVPGVLTTPMFNLYYQDAVSAWHLSKIESPGGVDVATYSYTTLPDWQRTETIWGESVSVTWSESVLTGYPQVSSTGPASPRNYTHTIFSGQKLLKGITTRTARIEFKTMTDENSYYYDDTPSMLTGIRVFNADGECVRDISLGMSSDSRNPRMLKSVELRSEGSLLDSHEFSYFGEVPGGGGYDFFGYRNSSSFSETRTVIDPETGRLNPAVIPDPESMKSRAMSCHKTGMGVTTVYEYEASYVTQSGNGKRYTFPVGLRIKSITSEDTITGRTRKREFTYSSPACDVDFTELDAGYFTGLSGDYINVMLQGTLLILHFYTTSITFYASSKMKGFKPENATVYHGVVEESVSGTGISNPIKTRYEYDLSRCKRGFIPANPSNVRKTDVRSLTYGFIHSNFPQSFKDGMLTGAIVRGTFMDGSGFAPRLVKKIEYEYAGASYSPRKTERYHYITVDSASLVTGVYHESAVRSVVDVYNVRHKDYTSTEQFSYGNSVMSCSGSLLDSVSTVRHFPNGAERHSSTRYLYSGSTRMPLIKSRSSKVIVDFIKPGDSNEFGIDTLSVSNGARTCYGIRRREGGHVTEHYTAVSGMFSTPFFEKVRGVQQKTLPVREIWVVDGTDTITRTWEYGLFNGAYRPTLIRLAGKGDTEMDRQRIKGYTAYGRPTGVLRKGKPEVSYKWGYDGDLLMESTESGGGLSLTTAFTHKPLVGCLSRKAPDGSVTQYTYNGGRLSSVTNGDGAVIKRYSYSLFGEGTSRMNATVEESRVSYASSAGSSGVPAITTTVYDGFGFPVAVSLGDFGNGGDVAEITQYDGMHRPVRNWSPLPVSNLPDVLSSPDLLSGVASGNYDGDSHAYCELEYPASKEERPSSETIPGDGFSDHPVQTVFTCSGAAAGKYRVQRFSLQGSTVKSNGYYGAGELDCEARTDGNGNELLIFTDALGRTVLERRSATGGKYADTYTISDSWGNPLVVLPPMASSLMENAAGSWVLGHTAIRDYAFIYTYDNALRVRSRVDAGVRKTEFAYDSDGRLAFSKESGKRVMFHTYDPLGRDAVTGTCAEEGKEQLWTSDMSGQTPPMTMTRTGRKGTGFLG